MSVIMSCRQAMRIALPKNHSPIGAKTAMIDKLQALFDERTMGPISMRRARYPIFVKIDMNTRNICG